MRVVGHVEALYRYPVKSMAGERLTRADVGWHGLVGDRRVAFVRPGRASDGFPWLTLRQRPDMDQFVPRFLDADVDSGTGPQPSASTRPTISVRTPDGRELPVHDRDLAELLGAETTMTLDRGTFDVAPLSLISSETVATMAAATDTEPDDRRWRPNVVVTTAGDPFAENEWVGAELQLGGLRIRVDKDDRRCMIVNLDPAGTGRQPAVLRYVATHRDLVAGVYCTITRPGPVAVGDEVAVVD